MTSLLIIRLDTASTARSFWIIIELLASVACSVEAMASIGHLLLSRGTTGLMCYRALELCLL